MLFVELLERGTTCSIYRRLLKSDIKHNDFKSKEFKTEDSFVKSFNNLPAKITCKQINALKI